MTAKSDYLEDKIINHVLRNTAFTSPGTSIYVALYTTNPGEDNSGTEVSAGGYARIQVTAWDAPSNGATSNTSNIDFPEASASWGTITHVGILDALTVGNLLYYGALTASKAVAIGESIRFLGGALDISET